MSVIAINRKETKMKKTLIILCLLFVLCGCVREAEMANYNLKRDADYFNVYHKVTAINTWTDTP